MRLLAVAALTVAALGSSSHAATKFRIGIAAPTVNMLPLWMGESAGLFQARGLDVEIVNTDGGSRGLAEVGAGRLEAMTVGLSANHRREREGRRLSPDRVRRKHHELSFFWGEGHRLGREPERQDGRRQRVRLGVRQRGIARRSSSSGCSEAK
jgi:hypothetical protein